MKRWAFLLAAGVALALAAALAMVWSLNLRDEADGPTDAFGPASAVTATPALIEKGAYLARAGNCMSCHTARGGAPYAGGRGIATPFGTVFSSNLTPDERTGLGNWSPAHFWRALHHGRSRDGHLLYPAFPYTSTTQVSREDSDALYAYLRSLPPVAQPNTPHDLRWPYSTQAALAVWRALFFKPGAYQADPTQSADWNRGAYLVKGLGHCGACHTARNALGASDDQLDLAGGLIPMQNWYAPSLTLASEAGMANWDTRHIVALLKTGVSPGASATGPMAEVVLNSTQYLSDADLGAMATFLKALPQAPAQIAAPSAPPPTRVGERGAKLYEQHCAQCHGERGEGVVGAYPALAGNRAVTMASTANLVQIVLHGAYAPATAGNPRPFGMPPYVLQLNDHDVAAVLSYLRSAWGHQASGVSEFEVSRWRDQPTR
jgi:mono/diheme cytochrome c family protein